MKMPTKILKLAKDQSKSIKNLIKVAYIDGVIEGLNKAKEIYSPKENK